jgi:flagellar protein FlgJ
MVADVHMEDKRNERLAEVARIAVKLEAETGLPAQLLIAQWALESKWGQQPAGQANFFGIKKADRHEKCCTVTTREVVEGRPVVADLEFADYDSLEDSCGDYAWLITHGAPYREAWAQYQLDKNVHNLLSGIAHIYATDMQYGQLVTRIAEQSNVAQAVREARAKAAA